jgi:hypothetical protein
MAEKEYFNVRKAIMDYYKNEENVPPLYITVDAHKAFLQAYMKSPFDTAVSMERQDRKGNFDDGTAWDPPASTEETQDASEARGDNQQTELSGSNERPEGDDKSDSGMEDVIFGDNKVLYSWMR